MCIVIPPPSLSAGAPVPCLFDRALVRVRRERAAANYSAYSFLKNRSAKDVAERLEHMPQTFTRILDIGGHTGMAGDAIASCVTGVSLRVHADLALGFARCVAPGAVGVVADEEHLPFAPASFDLIVSCLSMHWVNDLAGAFAQIRACLRPGGVFIGSVFGGGTLLELRQCLIAAESAHRDGVAMRVSPFAGVRDLAGLLVRAGFARPVADRWSVTAHYKEPSDLIGDLRGMGETAAPMRAGAPLTPGIARRAMELYRQDFADEDGRIPARFEILTATGWAP